jgi:membrane-anchored mycosin MYCP
MRITKTAALTATVLVGLLGSGPAPAVAQSSQTGNLTLGIPPAVSNAPLPGAQTPNNTVGVPPGSKYQQSQACITSTAGGTQIQPVPAGQLWMRLDQAHQYATGKNQTVAVIDTGVNKHQYFQNRIDPQIDYLAGATTAPQLDCDGHGTEVAGIIAADTKGNTGFTGVAPDANILPIRQSSHVIQFTPPNGQAQDSGTSLSLAYAIMSAVQNNATVINMSLAACLVQGQDMSDQQTLRNVIHWAVSKGVVIVAAAGNLNQQPPCNVQNTNPRSLVSVESPAWFADDVLSVAAIATTNDSGQRNFTAGAPAPFSIWGPWVSIAAPGTAITTLDPASNGLANQEVVQGQQTPLQGTSYAAPYVAGLAALVKQKFPKLDAYQVMHRIEMTAQHPAAPGGRNNQVGYGMIDPVAALTVVVPGEPNSPAMATGQQIRSDVRVTAGQNTSPMVIALLGTLAGVTLLLNTLFIVHATNRAKLRNAPAPSRLKI